MLSRCRFRYPFYKRTRDAQAMGGSVSPSRTAAKPSAGIKREGKTPTGVSGIRSTVKSAGRARRQVDW